MVSACALPLMGGIETHVHEVSTRLGAAGVDVTVLTTDRSGDLPVEQKLPGYRVRRFPAYPRSRELYLAPGLARHLLRADNYDVVHLQGVRTLVAPAALAAARRAGIPTVMTFHTGRHPSALRNSIRPLQLRLFAPLFRSAAAHVAVSEYERQMFAALLGETGAAIRLIRNGCDPLPVDASAEIPEGSPLLVSVGRLERYKGHHRILEALPAILAQAPDARLAVIGSGPYEQPLRAMASRLGVSDRVSICAFGPERRGAMGKLVAEADVCCLLSEGESTRSPSWKRSGRVPTRLSRTAPGFPSLDARAWPRRLPSRQPPSKSRPRRLQSRRRRRRSPPFPAGTTAPNSCTAFTGR